MPGALHHVLDDHLDTLDMGADDPIVDAELYLAWLVSVLGGAQDLVTRAVSAWKARRDLHDRWRRELVRDVILTGRGHHGTAGARELSGQRNLLAAQTQGNPIIHLLTNPGDIHGTAEMMVAARAHLERVVTAELDEAPSTLIVIPNMVTALTGAITTGDTDVARLVAVTDPGIIPHTRYFVAAVAPVLAGALNVIPDAKAIAGTTLADPAKPGMVLRTAADLYDDANTNDPNEAIRVLLAAITRYETNSDNRSRDTPARTDWEAARRALDAAGRLIQAPTRPPTTDMAEATPAR